MHPCAMHCSLVFQLIHRRFVPWSSVRCFLQQQMDKHRWKSKFIREREKWLLTIRCLDNFNWWVIGLLNGVFLAVFMEWHLPETVSSLLIFATWQNALVHKDVVIWRSWAPSMCQILRACPSFRVAGLVEKARLVTAYDIEQNYFESLLLIMVWNKGRHQFLNVNLIKPSSTGLMTKWVTIWKFPELYSLESQASTMVLLCSITPQALPSSSYSLFQS